MYIQCSYHQRCVLMCRCPVNLFFFYVTFSYIIKEIKRQFVAVSSVSEVFIINAVFIDSQDVGGFLEFYLIVSNLC